MAKKPRCPECQGVSVAIYRRRGKAAAYYRIDGWCYCAEHGPRQADSP